MTKGRHQAGRVYRHTGHHHRVEPSRVAAAAVSASVVVATMATIPGIALADDDGTNWAAIAACESGGNPRASDSSGQHIGMYQFTRSTWRSNGGRGDPRDASPAEQTRVARNVQHSQGMGAWPVCGRHAWDGTRPRPFVARSTSSAPRHAAPDVLVKHEKNTPRPHYQPAPPAVTPPADTAPTQPDAVTLLADTPSSYTVQNGDTLWDIAAAHHLENTGTTPAWRRISDANHLDNPDLIHPGQVLQLPA